MSRVDTKHQFTRHWSHPPQLAGADRSGRTRDVSRFHHEYDSHGKAEDARGVPSGFRYCGYNVGGRGGDRDVLRSRTHHAGDPQLRSGAEHLRGADAKRTAAAPRRHP
jgi:hypothetical protein